MRVAEDYSKYTRITLCKKKRINFTGKRVYNKVFTGKRVTGGKIAQCHNIYV